MAAALKKRQGAVPRQTGPGWGSSGPETPVLRQENGAAGGLTPTHAHQPCPPPPAAVDVMMAQDGPKRAYHGCLPQSNSSSRGIGAAWWVCWRAAP